MDGSLLTRIPIPTRAGMVCGFFLGFSCHANANALIISSSSATEQGLIASLVFVSTASLLIIFTLAIFLIKKNKRYSSLFSEQERKIKIAGGRIVEQISQMAVSESNTMQLMLRYQILVEKLSEGIIVIQDDELKFANSAFYSMIGYTPDEYKHKKIEELLFEDEIPMAQEYHAARLSGLEVKDRYLLRMKTHDGGVIYTEISGAVISWNGQPAILNLISNVTGRVKNENTIKYMAHHDILTKLPNRVLFEDRLRQAIHHAQRHSERIALLFIDLDKFKYVNDVYGHAVGDILLKHIAEQLRHNVRPTDTIARWGGDEFIVIVPSLRLKSDIFTVAEKILKTVCKPCYINQDITLNVSCSIGVSVYPDHAFTADELLQNSDEAMYMAKNNGRGNVQLLFPISDEQSIEQLNIKWSKNYESGISEIDHQHQRLFELANTLLSSECGTDKSLTTINKSLALEILHEIVEHFHHEEKILSDIHYPAYEAHIRMHQRLLHRARRIISNGGLDDIKKFLAFEIIYKHLLIDDKKWFAYIPSFGLVSSSVKPD